MAHSISHVLEDSGRWWKSENGQPKVTIDVDLGQEFFVTGIILKMGPTPRPSEWVLERSVDSGKTYLPWQYFESNPENCKTAHNILYNVSLTLSNQVLCKVVMASDIEYDEVVVKLLENRPGWERFGTSERLQNWTKATNIRLRFLDWGTHFGHLMYKDRSVDKTRFYTLQGISIFGRCVCYGHDRGCDHDGGTGRMVCKCQHNTCGPQCNSCCPGFNQHRWQPSRRCEACNCYGHANECYYNSTVEELKLSKNLNGSSVGGGVCINCRAHTAGVNCEHCEDGFYRPAQKPTTNLDACKECKCDPRGSINNICQRIGGQCQCVSLVGGRACDRCFPEHWGFPNCQPCNCSTTGSFRIGTCNENTGQCLCKTGTVGRYCDQCLSQDRYLMTSDGCLECDPCSLIHYRTINQLLQTTDPIVTADWSSKSWVDVRLQWSKASLQHLRNIWKEVTESDLNANRRVGQEQVKLVKDSLLSQLEVFSEKSKKSFKKLVKNVTSLLYRQDAIKLVDDSFAAKTKHLSISMQQSYESCQGAVGKLREIRISRHSRAIDDYINEAKLLYSSMNDRNFYQNKGICYHERTLAKNLYRKVAIFKGHYLQFQRLRKQLNYLQTRIADIDTYIWDANSNLNQMNSLRRTSERLLEVKQKISAIFKEKERLEGLRTIIIELKELKNRFMQVVENNYRSIPTLTVSKLKKSLSDYQKSLRKYEEYKSVFEANLQTLNGNVTEIKGVYKHGVEKPQWILNNIVDEVKIIYLSRKPAREATATLNQVSGIMDQFKSKFVEWFPEQKLETTTASAVSFENVTQIIDEGSSGFIDDDDDDDDDDDGDDDDDDDNYDIDWNESLLADEVFVENDKNIQPSVSKSSDVEFRNDYSSEKLTGLRTKVQEHVEKVRAAEAAVQRSGEALESAVSTLKHHSHSRTASVPRRLVLENKKLFSRLSKLLDNVTMTDELKLKYGRIYLAMRSNTNSIKFDVEKAFSSLGRVKDLIKHSIGPQPLKSDVFSKLATSLKEKITQAKAKAGKIRAPLKLTSPGFVKLALPAALAPPYAYITSFDIWFNSASGEGFIFRIGNSSETWGTSILLCLSSSRLEMQIHQNRHVWKGRHPISIQSNRWYRVEMEWICSQLKVKVTAARGKSHLQEDQLPWTCDLDRSFVPFVWIGGLDDKVETRVLSISGDGLPDMDGCIGDFSINEGTLNLFAWEASRGIQASCISSEKDKHHKISGVSIKNDVMQVHSTEDELFPPLVEFSFRSTLRNATIVHITDVKREDWMDVKLTEGRILVEFGHGHKTKLNLSSQLPYNNGQLHHVNVNFTGKEILKQVLVSVNGIDRHSGALFVAQPKPTNIYIGGIPSRPRGYHGPTSLQGNFPAFIGCVIGLKVNNKTLAISNHSENLEFSLESCPVKMGTCMCLSTLSGVIRVVRLGYIIDFLGLTFQINNLDSVTQGTILYYTPSPKNHLEIFVLDYGVWVAWKVESEFKRVKLTHVDNGTWHSVLLQNRYKHKNSSVLHLDEASVDLPLNLFLGVKYTAQHIVFLGGKSLGKTHFRNICYKNFLLNDETKDFSDIAISNYLTNCPLIPA